MDVLRDLAEKAAKEIRSVSGPGMHTRALANHFNSLITKIASDTPAQFEHDRWARIVQAMGGNSAKIGDELFYWVSAIGGEICLLLIADQCEVPKDHLILNVLGFCDAVDIVGV